MIWNIENHRRVFPHSAIMEHEDRLYGCWMIGNNYKRKVGYYGEFPPGFLSRILSLFPEPRRTLHVFSGVIPQSSLRPGDVTVDRLVPNIPMVLTDIGPTHPGNAEHLSALVSSIPRFDLVIADPPYGKADCTVYGCKMPNKARVMQEIRKVIAGDGVLCWLDLRRPMYRKEDWIFSGMIAVDCGTNRRVRALTIFRPKLAGENTNEITQNPLETDSLA